MLRGSPERSTTITSFPPGSQPLDGTIDNRLARTWRARSATGWSSTTIIFKLYRRLPRLSRRDIGPVVDRLGHGRGADPCRVRQHVSMVALWRLHVCAPSRRLSGTIRNHIGNPVQLVRARAAHRRHDDRLRRYRSHHFSQPVLTSIIPSRGAQRTMTPRPDASSPDGRRPGNLEVAPAGRISSIDSSPAPGSTSTTSI